MVVWWVQEKLKIVIVGLLDLDIQHQKNKNEGKRCRIGGEKGEENRGGCESEGHPTVATKKDRGKVAFVARREHEDFCLCRFLVFIGGG